MQNGSNHGPAFSRCLPPHGTFSSKSGYSLRKSAALLGLVLCFFGYRSHARPAPQPTALQQLPAPLRPATLQQAPAEAAFTDRDASALLRQLSEAIEARSLKKLLSLFDLSRMKDGALFQQQLNAFLSHTDAIRVHLNLVSVESQPAAMAVDAEMETQSGDTGPVTRRAERLTFMAVPAGKAWKFVDLQPRSFFSLP